MPSAAAQYYREPRITLLARPTFTEPEHLPVAWLGESTDGERLAEFAGRLCYRASGTRRPQHSRYLENIRSRDMAVAGARDYSLLVEGVSRSLTHELVRPSRGVRLLSSRSATSRVGRSVRRPPAVIGDDALEGAGDRRWTPRSPLRQPRRQLMTRYAWVGDRVHRRKMLAKHARRASQPTETKS